MHATLAPTGHATEPDQRAEAGLRRWGTPAPRTESRARKTTPGGGLSTPPCSRTWPFLWKFHHQEKTARPLAASLGGAYPWQQGKEAA